MEEVMLSLSYLRNSLEELQIASQEQLDRFISSLDSKKSVGIIENHYPFSYIDSSEKSFNKLECSPSNSFQRHLDISLLENSGGATHLVSVTSYCSFLAYKIIVVYIALRVLGVECIFLYFKCFRFVCPMVLSAGVLGTIWYPT